MASVTLTNIQKVYDGGVHVIKGVDLKIADGEFMVFVGPSGCGKSTMMRMIAGLETITEGELRIGDRVANDLPPVERKVAMVFQSYALYPHMSVAENMGFGLKINGMSASEVKAQVGKAADILQITHLLDRKPKALSGGQRQRVAIGRAIVRKPDVFLFDEPLSNLDAGLRVQMRVELSNLHRELGATMIYVTHDQTEAMTLGDRIAVFNKGYVEQVGAPMEMYSSPANTFVAAFLGSPKMNLLPCQVVADTSGSLHFNVADSNELVQPAQGFTSFGAKPRKMTLGIRPEAMSWSESGEGLRATVQIIERLGDVQLIHAQVAGTDYSVCVKVAETGQTCRVGQSIVVSAVPKACYIFNEDGKAV
jgi:multiple sugar transport system ATP-binding protein